VVPSAGLLRCRRRGGPGHPARPGHHRRHRLVDYARL